MSTIAIETLAEVTRKLPNLVPWDADKPALHDAVVVCCAGFEDRSTAIVSALAGKSIAALLLISYPTNRAENARANSAFGKVIAANRIELEYNRQTFLKDFASKLSPLQKSRDLHIVVDVSGMASYVMVRALATIWKTLPLARLSIFYAEADGYHPTQNEWTQFFSNVSNPKDNLIIAEQYEQTYFQSKGVEETFECDVFPGRNNGPLATEVVAVPGFSLQRLKAMLAFAESQYNVSADEVQWFLGQPPDKSRNGWRYDAMASLYNVENGGVAVSTRDYLDIFQKLDSRWEKRFGERHLVVASMGSKMQHVGIFLFLQMHQECGLLHCEPECFLTNQYSFGVGPCWWLEFGPIQTMAQILALRGSLRFIW